MNFCHLLAIHLYTLIWLMGGCAVQAFTKNINVSNAKQAFVVYKIFNVFYIYMHTHTEHVRQFTRKHTPYLFPIKWS